MDYDDYEKIKSYTWSKDGKGYLYTRLDKNKSTYIHKLLLKLNNKEKIMFIDRNNRNYQKVNLKIIPKSYSFAKKNPSKVIEFEDHIIIIPNNTLNEFIFPKNLKELFYNNATIESNRGYLKINYKHKWFLCHYLVRGHQINNNVTDHIDRNPKNNLPENLRIVPKPINYQNRSLNNKSGFLGVTWDKKNNKWKASIIVNKVKHIIGYYDDIIDAARAYDKFKINIFKEYATTNSTLNCYEEYYKKHIS